MTPHIECRRSSLETPLRADLDSEFWRLAQWQRIATRWDGAPVEPSWQTDFACRWTARYLYFAFRTHYVNPTVSSQPVLDRRTHELWNQEDVVEIFLAPELDFPNRYKEFELSPSGQWIDIDLDWERGYKDFEWNSAMESMSRLDSARQSWAAEFRVPIESFSPAKLAAGSEVAINAFRVELKSNLYLAWSPTFTDTPNFHVPSRFGRMTFTV